MGNTQSLSADPTVSSRVTGINDNHLQVGVKDSLRCSDRESCCDTDSDEGEFQDCLEGAANWKNSDDEEGDKIQLVDGSSSSSDDSESSLSALDRLLVQQRRERQLELRSIQENNKRVTDGRHCRRLDRFFARWQTEAANETSSTTSDDSDDSETQNSPGPVVLEVRGLFEAQPVTSVLQSDNFRTQLEGIIRGNLIRQEREMETALRLRNAGLGANMGWGRTLTDAFVLPNLHEDGSIVSSSTQSSSNIHPAAAVRHQAGNGIPAPPPPPPPGYVNQFAPIPAQLPPRPMPQAYQQQNINHPQQSNNHRQAVPQVPRGQMPVQPTSQQSNRGILPQSPWLLQPSAQPVQVQGSNLVEDLQQFQRETIINEISNLVQGQMVTSTLASNFRGQLEVLLQNRVSDRELDGTQVMNYVQNLPRSSNIRRNDFSHLGIGGRPMTGPTNAMVAGPSSNEMVHLQQQMAELQNMVRVSFDLQLDLQRAIRQEVAAALHGATAGTTNVDPVSGAAAKEPHPANEGHCIICLDKSIDAVLYQCGHMCVCLACGLRLKDLKSHCPMCRAPIRDVIRAYKCHEQ